MYVSCLPKHDFTSDLVLSAQVPLFNFDGYFTAILIHLCLCLLPAEAKELFEHEPEHRKEAQAVDYIEQESQRLFFGASTTKDDACLVARRNTQELEEDRDEDDSADACEG